MKLKTLKLALSKISFYSILLYYSTLLSTILVIGGLYTAQVSEIIAGIVFLPVVVFLWITVIKRIRNSKKRAGRK